MHWRSRSHNRWVSADVRKTSSVHSRFTPCRSAFGLLPTLGIALWVGCAPANSEQKKRPPPIVICQNAESQTIIDFDEYLGRTEPVETVEVRARVSGFIRSIDFKDGAMVTEGQTLATIEPDEYEAIYQQSLSRIALWESKLDLAKTIFRRAEKLIVSAAISQEEYDEDQAAVKEAESQVVAAKADAARTALDVKYTTITAPISGHIDRAFVTRGNLVTGGLGSGTLLTRIVNDTPMYAYFDVDERSCLRYIRKANALREDRKTTQEQTRTPSGPLRDLNIPCYLQLQDETEFGHSGFLDFAENRVDEATGTLRLRGIFDNENQLLRGGLFVRVRIETSQPYDATLIPEQAIGIDQGDKFAYVVGANDTVERRKLVLGDQRGSMRIITSGIQSGERVIVKGIQRVQPGMQVRTQEDQESNDVTPPPDRIEVAAPPASSGMEE
jgi:RND family efflux transporter MFP subunit